MSLKKGYKNTLQSRTESGDTDATGRVSKLRSAR